MPTTCPSLTSSLGVLDGGTLTASYRDETASNCRGLTLDPSGTRLYAACLAGIVTAPVDSTTATFAFPDAGTGAYPDTTSMVWVVP